jgi:hypothetical protein
LAVPGLQSGLATGLSPCPSLVRAVVMGRFGYSRSGMQRKEFCVRRQVASSRAQLFSFFQKMGIVIWGSLQPTLA